MPRAEEGFTTGRLGRLSISQPSRGYRFSIDSVLLAARGLAGPFQAVELDPAAAAACRQNFQAAGLAGRVLEHDLTLDHPALPAAAFALVISNPPFGRAGQGRIPPDPARAAARHELTLKAPALWARAARLLAPSARLAVCLPPRRLAESLAGLMEHGLTPKRLRLVHGRAGKPASLALIEAVRKGGQHLAVEPPLIVYGQGQAYTPEVAAIYASLE